jgi:hypothetical protein
MFNNQSTSQKLASMATKPLINGGLVYLGSKLLGVNGTMDNPVFGSMEASQQLALGAAVSSVGTQVVHSWILPELGNGNFYDGTSMLLSPVLQGLLFSAYAGLSDGFKSAQLGQVELIGLGAVSEVGASYLNDGVLRPWMGF